MWADKETDIDFLNFGYMVDLVANIATDKTLTPSTIGLYGDWGSGKSSLMKFALKEIERRAEETKSKKKAKAGEDEDTMPMTLCIEFNGWLFEGYEDTKTSLCGTILDALADEKRFTSEVVDYAKSLRDKIDFKKLLGKGAKYGLDIMLTGGIGSLADITLSSILNTLKSSASEIQSKDIEELISKFKKDEKTRTEIKNFRAEFAKLLKKSKVEHLVVFIDELDRCTPDTVLEVFEAMRLFLFVDGMSFVIGADQRLIQYAIKTRYKEVPGNNLDIGKEYLEKVIQYPITIPQLNFAEVNQYLSCLLVQETLTDDGEFGAFLKVVHELKPDEELTYERLEEKADKIAEKCKTEIALAKQISSVLAPSINGNPRQCKRFLNTLFMRFAMAKSRGVDLNKNILAKLMLAEYFNPDFFEALTKEDNKEDLKAFEIGENIGEGNAFSAWKDDAWVKSWRNNGTTIGDEKLGKYVYFANVKNRYGHSKLDMLSPSAKRCFDLLVGGTDTGRNEALKNVKHFSAGEQTIITSELFSIIETSSEMNDEVLRSFTDFAVEVNMEDYAVKKLMEIPAEKYTYDAYGQLTMFIGKLSQEQRDSLNAYLMTNQTIAGTIERTKKATSAIKSLIKKK